MQEFCALRPRLHDTGRLWDRSEIRPFSPVYTRIRSVRGSQIRPVPWFSCVYTAETAEFQTDPKFVRYRVNGVLDTLLGLISLHTIFLGGIITKELNRFENYTVATTFCIICIRNNMVSSAIWKNIHE
jgi:hypothetical protein